MEQNLSDILKFLKLLHLFQQVRRATLVTGEDRQENDFEHSYQLAMLGWYLIERKKLKLDSSLVVSVMMKRVGLCTHLIKLFQCLTIILTTEGRGKNTT